MKNNDNSPAFPTDLFQPGNLPGPSHCVPIQSAGFPVPVAAFQSPIDWDEALKSVMGDKELLNELIGIFLETLPQWLTGLQSAIASRDQDTSRRLAHTLKGSLSQFGALATETAQRLEHECAESHFAQADVTLIEVIAALDQLKPVFQEQLDQSLQ